METSVIVPVYNVRDYIENTLCSILNNSYEDYELIVIDDGSTDGTPAIVRNLRRYSVHEEDKLLLRGSALSVSPINHYL